MPVMDGMELLEILNKQHIPMPVVIVITAHGSIERAVKAVQLGAFDFIEKPVEMDRLLITVNNAVRASLLTQENVELKKHFSEEIQIVGDHPEMDKVKEMIKIGSNTKTKILITGENGTGKDLVARKIHLSSDRACKPYIVLNCAAIPDHLVENELFGHEKGSFTSAFQSQKGKFELASEGTLFLNEIGDLNIEAQAKLLHVIESEKVMRIGSSKERSVDVRIIAATNKDLHEAMENGLFRKDLFYRIDVFQIHLPPLRKRGLDIILLADFFLNNQCSKNGLMKKQITNDAKEILLSHLWPGNVRELRNFIERVVLFVGGEKITAEDVHKYLFNYRKSAEAFNFVVKNYKNAKEEWEKYYLESALEKTNWSISKTASNLEIERTYLYRLMKRHNITKP
jgi:two-component system nitrogen regulation response regulator NtrX